MWEWGRAPELMEDCGEQKFGDIVLVSRDQDVNQPPIHMQPLPTSPSNQVSNTTWAKKNQVTKPRKLKMAKLEKA